MGSLRIDQLVVAGVLLAFMGYLVSIGHLIAFVGVVAILVAAIGTSRARRR